MMGVVWGYFYNFLSSHFVPCIMPVRFFVWHINIQHINPRSIPFFSRHAPQSFHIHHHLILLLLRSVSCDILTGNKYRWKEIEKPCYWRLWMGVKVKKNQPSLSHPHTLLATPFTLFLFPIHFFYSSFVFFFRLGLIFSISFSRSFLLSVSTEVIFCLHLFSLFPPAEDAIPPHFRTLVFSPFINWQHVKLTFEKHLENVERFSQEGHILFVILPFSFFFCHSFALSLYLSLLPLNTFVLSL